MSSVNVMEWTVVIEMILSLIHDFGSNYSNWHSFSRLPCAMPTSPSDHVQHCFRGQLNYVSHLMHALPIYIN